MADKEDSVRIKIKLDVSDEDKEFADKISRDLEKTSQKKSTVEDEKDPKTIKKNEQRKKNTAEIKAMKKGPVGQVHNFTKKQTANLKEVVTNPGGYFMGVLTKKLGKIGVGAARAGLAGIIAVLVYETVLFVIDQFMQPGRWLDRRFRRIARVETMNFYERTLQEELRHGYLEMRVTTIQGLRGGESQVNGNLFEFSSGTTGILQSSPYRSSQQIYGHAYLSGSGIDNRGNPKRRTVSGRFG